MPGSVAVASPSTVFPFSLCRSFQRKFAYDGLENGYPNGESQRSTLVGSPRRTWIQTKRLTPAAAATLITFFNAHHGPHLPFWFYDIFDPTFAAWDPSGTAAGGRFKARFEGGISLTGDVARGDVPVTVMEIG